MNVLVVDDAASARERLTRLVRAIPGVQSVAEAEDSVTALDAIERAAPDLIVLDLNLPGISGLELLPLMKERVPHALVVVLTSHAGPAYEVRCRVLGADFFFDKSNQFHRALEVVWANRHSAPKPTAVAGKGMNRASRSPNPQSGSRYARPEKIRKT